MFRQPFKKQRPKPSMKKAVSKAKFSPQRQARAFVQAALGNSTVDSRNQFLSLWFSVAYSKHQVFRHWEIKLNTQRLAYNIKLGSLLSISGKLPSGQHEDELHTVLRRLFQSRSTRQNEIIIEISCNELQTFHSNPVKHPRQPQEAVDAVGGTKWQSLQSINLRLSKFLVVNAEIRKPQALFQDWRLTIGALQIICLALQWATQTMGATLLEKFSHHRCKSVNNVQVDLVECRAAVIDSTNAEVVNHSRFRTLHQGPVHDTWPHTFHTSA